MCDNIDNEILISLIKERPAIWDKTLDIYTDRNATRNAWHEVCLRLRSDFNQLEEQERNDFGKEVMKRWKHLRDAFARAEREIKTSGSKALKKRRKYIFYDDLQFLKKLYKNTDTTKSFIVGEIKDETVVNWQQHENTLPKDCHKDLKTPQGPSTATEEKAPPNQPPRKRSKMDEVDSKILEILDKREPPNPRMSFFESLLPHTENFSSNQWLQFQMEVLRLISNIKNQKGAAPQFQGNTTQCSSQSEQHMVPYGPVCFHMVPHYPQVPRSDPSSIPPVSTPNAQFTALASYPSQQPLLQHYDLSASLVTKGKTTAADQFAEYVSEEECQRSSSPSSINSSIDMNF